MKESEPFRRYLGRIFAGKFKRDALGLKEVKVILKRILAKGINLLQPTGVDEYPMYAVAFFLQGIEQLAS
ncbi:MAG: hypothetical protein JRF30_07705 [Deltaproteobacteria bacterium]|nr:hypothetical protein [Deltaproteobacteria bacterium]MBW1796534.1 hypothetical protein [Deltaproteobacteria bacterium]MBW2330799.1 hypothetical protein [Deltaproteobacteria bacterium]